MSQLGAFREYVEPSEPAVVLWFVNLGYLEAREEANQPLLMSYLRDPSFSQRLRLRQHEIDSFVWEIVVPITESSDHALQARIASPSPFPLGRVVKLNEVRSAVGFEQFTRPPPAVPDLSYFERSVAMAVEALRRWNGRLIIVITPSYELLVEDRQDVIRHRAVMAVLRDLDVGIVDTPALFAEHPDGLSLLALRAANHPNQQGHALIAQALIAAIREQAL